MIDIDKKITITASVCLSAVLGSIHAFSVFVPQWETLSHASRGNVSLVYSTALVSLTVAVLFGYRLYARVSPPLMFAIAGVSAAAGLWLSAGASSLASLYLSYGVLFGFANGIGYGYTLQLSGQAAPENRGLAMGLVTAFYAVGATASPVVFVYLINRGGNALALTSMSVVILIVSLSAALLITWSKARFDSEKTLNREILSDYSKRLRLLLWIGYGSAVTAGLMIIGHAYGIALWANLDLEAATLGTMVVAFGNMLGGFTAGYYADRLSSKTLIYWLPVFSSLGLLLLIWTPVGAWVMVFIGLGLVGYSYGAIIALYPVTVTELFGSLVAPRVYGQVFTAWGLAGLVGPWVSGWLFDKTGSYTIAIASAVALSGISILAVRQIRYITTIK